MEITICGISYKICGNCQNLVHFEDGIDVTEYLDNENLNWVCYVCFVSRSEKPKI